MLCHRVKCLAAVALSVWLGGQMAAFGEKPDSFVFMPSRGEGPFPVAVWLHGYRGYSSDGYARNLSKEVYQKHADDLGAAIVGFPGTCDLGDGTQQWSEEPIADQAYIQWRLRILAQQHDLDLNNVALFGFSQGAVVAGDLVTIFPKQYSGALLLSPGCISEPRGAAEPSDDHKKLVVVSSCGAMEHPGTVELTKAYDGYLRKLGADCTLKLYPGVEKHDRPPDFADQFPKWMEKILADKEPATP